MIHPIRKRVVGDNAKDFKTEACVVLKQYAPLQCENWKKISEDNKKKMWLAMKQKFDLQENHQTKKSVLEQLNRQYRNRRHKLHAYYLKNKYEDDILQRPPKVVNLSDWEYLIDYFESDSFKRLSNINIENRRKLKMAHSCGTKSIAQYCFEDRDLESGKEPTRTSTWKKTRFSEKKGDWVDQDSRRVFEEISLLQNQGTDEDQEPITEDEAFIAVLGPEKSHRLRGCGDGLKPPSKNGQRIVDELVTENGELRKNVGEQQERNEEMALRIQSLESQLKDHQAQIQNQVQAYLKTQLPSILRNMVNVVKLILNLLFREEMGSRTVDYCFFY